MLDFPGKKNFFFVFCYEKKNESIYRLPFLFILSNKQLALEEIYFFIKPENLFENDNINIFYFKSIPTDL
jgi:hypothetical protein